MNAIVRDRPAVSLTSIARACVAVEEAEHESRERRFPEQEYRRVSQLIDDACERVELVNLAGGGACPADVSAFVAQLQRQADEPVRRPCTSNEAHDELFRLSCVLLGRPDDDLEIRPGGGAVIHWQPDPIGEAGRRLAELAREPELAADYAADVRKIVTRSGIAAGEVEKVLRELGQWDVSVTAYVDRDGTEVER